MSEQSRLVRMHLVRSATMSSLRHASAHAVHASAQAISASMAAASLSRSRLIDLGYAFSIVVVVIAGAYPRRVV